MIGAYIGIVFIYVCVGLSDDLAMAQGHYRCCRPAILCILTLCAVFLLCANLILVYRGVHSRRYLTIDRRADNAGSSKTTLPVLLWWTPFTGDAGSILQCGETEHSCFVTTNRTYFSHRRLAAAMFYGSDFTVWDLPLPRKFNGDTNDAMRHNASTQPLLWALLHEESPKNAPIFCHKAAISQFNVTATFSQYSDVPLTLQHLVSIDWLTGGDGLAPPPPARTDGLITPLAPVIYIASGCETPSQRDLFVRELSRYIAIDSYGACLNNRTMPAWAERTNSDAADLACLIVNYRFYLSLENAACDDYISEKLWLPLSLGVVPVYWGAGNVRQWLPCASAAVLVDEFVSVQQLATYLQSLLDNSDAYRRHLCHRQQQQQQQQTGVTNQQLLQALSTRGWGVVGEHGDHRLPSFIDAFECSVCDAVWSAGGDGGGRIADQRHYGCERPRTIMGDASDTWWTEQWERAAVEAEELAAVVDVGVAVSRDQFSTRVSRKLSPAREEL